MHGPSRRTVHPARRTQDLRGLPGPRNPALYRHSRDQPQGRREPTEAGPDRSAVHHPGPSTETAHGKRDTKPVHHRMVHGGAPARRRNSPPQQSDPFRIRSTLLVPSVKKFTELLEVAIKPKSTPTILFHGPKHHNFVPTRIDSIALLFSKGVQLKNGIPSKRQPFRTLLFTPANSHQGERNGSPHQRYNQHHKP